MRSISLILLLLMAADIFAQSTRPFDIEGHRGTRGWMPENTIPAFEKGLQLGADTLELDVVVTKDGKLVVSHEPWFSSVISLDKYGKPIPAENPRDFNIYKMTYAEVKQFDVGSLGNKDFPQQQKLKISKPLLVDVFKEIDKFARKSKLSRPRYNIEIKTEPGDDDVFNPKQNVFAKIVFDEITVAKMQKYVTVQSFDVRALQEMRKLTKDIPLSLLVANRNGVLKNLRALGFDPEIYSPNYLLVDPDLVKICHGRSIKVLPWTVNEPMDMQKMKLLDLDGIITDYPDRAVEAFRKP
ncbi:MAG: glycerophosphodiester phosphodiesterase family protein [Acidobacteriota bacterium]